MSAWNFAAILDDLAAVDGEHVVIVHGDRRISCGELCADAHALADVLVGLGCEPGSTIAIATANRPEFFVGFYGALLAGCIPANVNFRYTAHEVAYVLDDAGCRVVLHDAPREACVAAAVDQLGAGAPHRLCLDDAPGATSSHRATPSMPRRAPTGDDPIFLYTGGTTGYPKGVVWRNEDFLTSMFSGRSARATPGEFAARVASGRRVGARLVAAPLIHGTGLLSALTTLTAGGTVVLLPEESFDARSAWTVAAAERVQSMTIVGDAFAKPLLEELDQRGDTYDLSALRFISSSGVVFSAETKAGLLRHLPELRILDTIGASEGMGPSATDAAGGADGSSQFRVGDRVRVVDEATLVDVPHDGRTVGLLAFGPPTPLGYHGDPERTARTFRLVGGVRHAIPGDYATVEADGSIRLLGRGSACINSGGEKVFAEEVESVLGAHASVDDCAVLGVPHERFGAQVVALVVLDPSRPTTPTELTAWCRATLSGYKAPRRIAVTERLPRTVAGKLERGKLAELATTLLAAQPM